jgi:hypothetical protein
MHPRLIAAWDAFAAADTALRNGVEVINDRRAAERLAEIEQKDGRKAAYHVHALMIHAKRVLRAETSDKPDVAAMVKAVTEFEDLVKGAEEFSGNGDGKIGSSLIGNAKSFLVTSKQLMRRIRDKVPYSSGDQMMMGGGGAWMVEGSPARLLRDYNQMIDSYNRESNSRGFGR